MLPSGTSGYRIDEMVPPGTTINPADNAFDNDALMPTARRR